MSDADPYHAGDPASPEKEATPQERRAAAAKRALAEAAERRAAIDAHARAAAPVPEQAGRGGLEPVRYDDWEIEGRAVDF
ncbi:DUF1674 domain-containing protein [Enterovirga sp.]|uniref:DUF1674 domain-containing protein n=1 Tax=Enterovirga sp. TaxID=2026350 RepID=UPI002CA8C585|nr:DUF1674 domain-containing protein [Enterovirga sp.]HMO31095.1 DUF1674 domain-containing protein [Enterovirga sp.]